MAARGVWRAAVVSLLMLVESLHAQDKAEGRKHYVTFCSGCHGDTGKGNGPAAVSLPIKPTDHTDGTIMNQLSDRFLFDIISKGGPAVGKSPLMPAWGSHLREKQIRDLIAYLRSLAVLPYSPPGK